MMNCKFLSCKLESGGSTFVVHKKLNVGVICFNTIAKGMNVAWFSNSHFRKILVSDQVMKTTDFYLTDSMV